MPADYSSTARALALPVSPPRSPIITHQPIHTSWLRSQSNATRPRSHSPYTQSGASLRDRALDTSKRVQRQVLHTVKKLSPLQRILVGIAGVTIFVLTILFFVFNERIFHWLEPYAEKWKSIRGGWLILWCMTFVVAFPPLIGYSTCITIAGFVYGFPNG